MILNTNYEDKNSDKSEENYNNRHIEEESEECKEFDDLDEKIERTDKYVDNDEDVGNDEKKIEIGQFIKLEEDLNLSKIEWNKSDLRCKCISAKYICISAFPSKS